MRLSGYICKLPHAPGNVPGTSQKVLEHFKNIRGKSGINLDDEVQKGQSLKEILENPNPNVQRRSHSEGPEHSDGPEHNEGPERAGEPSTEDFGEEDSREELGADSGVLQLSHCT